MKLIVTILEENAARALSAVRTLDGEHDGVELRAEALGTFDLEAFRRAVPGTLILTHRGQHIQEAQLRDAIAAGVDLIDVEYHEGLDRELVRRHAERIVLSHHDYQTMPDIERIFDRMRSFGAAQTKIAVTPSSFRDNQRLLELMRVAGDGVTLIGMGARGLYSRILAPFFGSALQFVAPDGAKEAAPGQLALSQALQIYGERATLPSHPHLFAVAGNPAAHSLSPAIHNPLFREAGVAAAYAILDTDSLDDVLWPFAAGAKLAPIGLSVTAPFKDDAYRFARTRGASVAQNAVEAEAVNTLIRVTDREILADNTDVDGFASILEQIDADRRTPVALIGAGATARAALVALRRAGLPVTVYNRSPERAATVRADIEPLENVSSFDGEIIINTLPAGSEVQLSLRPGMSYVEAAYGPGLDERDAIEEVRYIDGIDLLLSQAVRQNELFVQAARRSPAQPLNMGGADEKKE